MNTREATRAYRITQWAQIFQERKIEGKKVQEFCESRGITRDSYYYWLRKVRDAASEQLAVREQNGIECAAPKFAKVYVAERSASAGTYESNRMSNEAEVCIQYGNVRLSVSSTYSPDKLAVFVRELAQI